MARQVLPVQKGSYLGITPTYQNAHADGHACFGNGGKTFLLVRNSHATESVTLIVRSQDVRNGLAREDQEIEIPALTSSPKVCGPFDFGVHEIKSGDDAGKLYINWGAGDVIASTSLAAIIL